MTGEICLSGDISKIGGLELKLGGGRRAGVKKFILPKDNKAEYDLYLERTDCKFGGEDPVYVELVTSIEEILQIVFTDQDH